MKCKFCGREINQAGSLAAHEKHCKQNPVATPKPGVKGRKAWNRGLKIKCGDPTASWKAKYPNEQIFVENSTYARHSLKARILNENLIEYRCACCGIEAMWCDKPMPLILDHINGVNNDNRLENLRFVCSNCDSQLITYKARNRKKK